MDNSNLKRVVAIVCLSLAAMVGDAGAQRASLDRQLPIDIDSDQSTLDLASGQMMHSNLKITQGATRIQAREAESSASRSFADSEWTFEGNVEIDVGETRIRADSATIRFLNNELVSAKVNGNPAAFSDINITTGERIEGAADKFDYDFEGNTVRFIDNARIRNADNEVTGKTLIYNVTEQKIVFEGDTDNGERVRITVQPPEEQTGDTTEDEASP